MDNKTVFVVTLRGEGELRNHTRHLSEDLKRALMLVDDTSTVEELGKRAAPSLRVNLYAMLQELADGWFVQDKTKMGHVPRMAVPRPLHKDEGGAELDFTDLDETQPAAQPSERGPEKEQNAAKGKQVGGDTVRLQVVQKTAKAEDRTGAEAKARQDAEAARLKAEREAANAKAQLEAAQARIEAEAKARADVEKRAKQEADAARLKAEQEAAKARAQLEAAQARIEAEAKARAEAETRVKQEAEAARFKAEQEAAEARAQLETAQARIEIETRARAEVELRAKQEAEAARLKAEQEAAEARAQLEAAQARIEVEARARAESEARAKQAAQEAQIKAEQEAADARAQLEAAQARIEAEARARAESEARVKQEAEAARVKAEQEAAEARAQLEAAQARIEAEARARSELEVRAKQEAEAVRLKAEQDAAEARALLEAAQARIESEGQARSEVETRAKQEAEAARLKAEQEAAKAREQLEAAQARLEAEARARAEIEARARQEAEAVRLKAEQDAAEARALLEAAQARIASEGQARSEVETRAKQEAETARQKAEQDAAKAREQLEAAQARMEIEARARVEAEAGAKQEADTARLKAEQEAAEARAQLEAAQARIESEGQIRAGAEAKARQAAEAALLKAEQDAAEARSQLDAAQARMEAEAKARVAAEARAKQEAEAALLKAEQEAAAARAQLEAAQARIEFEAKARAEAEAKAKLEAEAARLKAEQEAARLRSEVEAILLEAERKTAEARSMFEAKTGMPQAREIPAGAGGESRNRPGPGQEDAASNNGNVDQPGQFLGVVAFDSDKASPKTFMARPGTSSSKSMIATVLFLDIVGYTKLSVSKQIELKKWFNNRVWGFISEIEESTRIILDTGDGAAIGFLQHPEQAIEVALLFRQALLDSKEKECPELQIRMGINLGPVNVLMDMNGQSNMLGDGINDAQRIMSFAKPDHIYISRSYYDVISRLSGEYVKWLIYRGTEKDKHGRQYQVYEVTKGTVESTSGKQPSLPANAIDLGPFTFGGSKEDQKEDALLQSVETLSSVPEDESLVFDLADVGKVPDPAASDPGVATHEPKPEASETRASDEEKSGEDVSVVAEEESEEDRAQLEEDLRKMADEQTKAWKEAEQRARELAAAQKLAKAELDARQPEIRTQAQYVPRVPRKPLPLLQIFTGLILILVAMAFLLPYVWPMQNYIARLERALSERFHQPVHVAAMKAALLPLPKLELTGVSVGNAEQLTASKAVLNFSIAGLFSKVRPLSSVEIDDIEFRSDSFGDTIPWLQAVGSDMRYPVERLDVHNVHTGNPGAGLPAMSGTASFDGQGKVRSVELSSLDNKLTVALQPQDDKNQIVLNIRDGSLPSLFPGFRFDELNLAGKFGKNEVVFSEIDGQIFGGSLTGRARLSWQRGWQLAGHLTASKMGLQELLPGLGFEGVMQGDADFNMASSSLQQLARAVNMDGNFQVKKGSFSRLDVLEAARQSGADNVSGGRTHFDDMSGALQLQNNSVSIRQLRFSSEVMVGDGAINVASDGRLSGQLSVELKVRPERVSLQLSGTPAEPRLGPAK